MNNTPFTIEIISSFNDEYAFLSNFYPAIVYFEGAEYPTLEHAYQAAKTLNKKERELIRKCETAGQAKKMGRKVLMRDHWDRIKNDVMRGLIDQKFEIPELKTKLLATKEAVLIEGNDWKDTWFGMCNGVGLNFLGILLMLKRSQIFADIKLSGKEKQK